MRRVPFLPALLPVAVILSLATGCARTPQPPDFGSPEGHEVAKLITEDLQENVDQPRVLHARIFVAGAAPTGAAYQRFRECEYDVVGKPSVNGTEATAKIRVRNVAESKEIGVVEWTFCQEGAGGISVWKIKSAPIP